MDQVQIEEAAGFLLHLRMQRQQVRTLPPEITPRSLEDAYAVQDAMHAHAGWPIEVLKVGCTSEIAQEVLGIPEPIGGRIPSEAVFADGATVPSAFLAGTPLLECEFALRVTADGSVDAVAPAIELVNSRFEDTSKVAGPLIIADNSAGAGVILGTPTPIDDAGDLASIPIELRAGTEAVASGSAAALIAGPHGSIEWTLAHEAAQGRAVAAGTWIITGTCTGLTPSEAGIDYTADFGPLGTVTYRLD